LDSSVNPYQPLSVTMAHIKQNCVLVLFLF